MTEKLDYANHLEQNLHVEIKSVMAVVSNWMAIPLFLLFWIADIIYVPDQKWNFLALRLLIIPICLVSYNSVKKSSDFFIAQLISSFYLVSLSSVISVMLYQIGQPSTVYYAGLNLIAIAGLSFFPFGIKIWSFTLAGIYTPYLILIGINAGNFEELKKSVVNLFFITGSIVICLLIRVFHNRIRINEVNAKVALENELQSRERIIKLKTEEATKLHQLSTQFSPQIVKAIKNGQISIDECVKRVQICAIFIDIVRSTDKVTALPENDMQLSLARFLDSTLSIFLKYDLTIDKFHGDGILAFSNMPIQRDDYIERTCMAALEAVDAIKNDKEFYLTHWQSELQVRVGISVGYANVGFYGNKKYFKTFTAIGTPLPYASRLTSVAEPNQILIDSGMASHLEKFGYVTKNSGVRILKGFEDNKNFVYELVSSPNAVLQGENTKTCPEHVNSVLFLDTNQDGHFVFKCRECDYADPQAAKYVA